MTTLKTLSLLALAASTMATTNAFAKDYSCRMETEDVSTIEKHGSSSREALHRAVTECVQRREALYTRRGLVVDADKYEDLVVSCANTPCGN